MSTFPLKGKFLMRNSSFYPSAQISIEDAVTQTVDAVRLVIASVLQLRGIVASQEGELVQLRSEISRLRGLPLPLVRPPFTGFERIGVSSGGLSVSGYSPQNISAQSCLGPLPTTVPPNILPAPAVVPNTNNNNMLIYAAPAATSTLNATYSFFTVPAASTQVSPATTSDKPNALFPNPDTFLPSFILNPAYNDTSSSASNQVPEPGIPVTPPPTGSRSNSTYTPSRPNKSSQRKYSWDLGTTSPYGQR